MCTRTLYSQAHSQGFPLPGKLTETPASPFIYSISVCIINININMPIAEGNDSERTILTQLCKMVYGV